MNAGHTAERVYDGIKRSLMSGDFLPGEKLDPARFADDLHSSVTPVRDALHRLTGERLIETRVSDGFYLPLVTEPGLRDLYRWNALLARVMVARREPNHAGKASSGLAIDVGRATAGFFLELAHQTGDTELVQQAGSANDRLWSARVAETAVVTEVEAELRALAVVLDNGEQATLTKAVADYHRRRDRMVPQIVRAMYRR